MSVDVEDTHLCGFNRPMQGTYEELFSSTKPLVNHFFVSTPVSANLWPSEAYECSPVAGKLKTVLSAKKKSISPFAVTLFHQMENSSFTSSSSSCNVLLFPQMLSFNNVTTEDVDTILERANIVQNIAANIIGKDKSDNDCNNKSRMEMMAINNSCHHVFVCCHKLRDAKCGCCGPLLIEEFEKLKKSSDKVLKIYPISHIGGHKYAGNVLVYGEFRCEWYGYVKPEHVIRIITEDINKNHCLLDIWRGRVGMNSEELLAQTTLCISNYAASKENQTAKPLLLSLNNRKRIIFAVGTTAFLLLGYIFATKRKARI